MSGAEDVVRRYYDAVNRNEARLLDELLTEDAVNYYPAAPGGVMRGREACKALVIGFRTAFPDGSMTPAEIVASGHLVAVRNIARGTQHAPFAGIPPSGRRMEVSVLQVHRLTPEGRIYSIWTCIDTLALARQLGGV